MRNKLFLVLILLQICFSVETYSAGKSLSPKKVIWPFDGMFGKVDRAAAQRGFQVYKEVCASCHGLYHLYYRNLKEIGFSDAEIKEIAKNYTVKDGPDDSGDMFNRPAEASDFFVSPFPNEKAARASNNGAYPVDLSLIIKARKDGANYVYSLLTGYKDAPASEEEKPGMYYNPYFPGEWLAMAPPLSDNIVTYMDGTPARIEQMTKDLVVFLQWAAEPEMEHRKSMGLKVMIYLLIFTILFYIAKNRIWSRIEKN